MRHSHALVWAMVLMCAIYLRAGLGQQTWQYGLGAVSQNYLNYQQVSLQDPETASSFVTMYNSLGGIPSLGAPKLSNCLVNTVWGTQDIVSCQCPFTAPSNQLVLLAPAPSSRSCFQTLSVSQIRNVSSNPTAQIGIFRYTIPPGCNVQCTLHGICQSTGQCLCPIPPSNTSVYWTGNNCQFINPPPLYRSYPALLVWAPLVAPESFYFYLESSSPCSVYANNMPTDSQFNGKYVPVSQFTNDPTGIGFLSSSSLPPSQIVLSVFFVAPDSVKYCNLGLVGGSSIYTKTTVLFPGIDPISVSTSSLLPLPRT